MKIINIRLIILFFIIGIIIQPPVYAQFIVQRSVASSGGGEINNDNYRSTVAIGQFVIGHTTSGSNVNNIGYLYQILHADIIVVDINDKFSGFPNEFILEQNYPNPFNPETQIQYQLPGPSQVVLRIYNITGQLIATLVDTYQPAGYYTVQWNGKDMQDQPVASNLYIYHIQAGEFVQTKRMILLK